MADTNFRGPVNSMGSLEVDAATAAVQPLDGPSGFYQGVTLPDIRSAPFQKDGFRPGQQPGAQTLSDTYAVDNIPQARTTSLLAAGSVITSGVALSLQTVGLAGVASAASIAVGVPIIPLNTTVATFVIALDFGFTTGTTVANSSTVAVIDNTLFKVGQWIIVGNVGNSTATRSLVAQVQTIATANTTGLTILPVAGTGLSSVPIGGANLFGGGLLPPGTQFGPATASANAHSPYLEAGLFRVVNPREMLARNVSLNITTGTLTASVIVSGWDVWGAPMTELITNNAVTSAFGKKTFKYIGSVVPQTSIATTFFIGLGDTFGVPYRADEFEQTEMFWNGSTVANSNGFVAAVAAAATNTTGDVRGTVQLSTSGALATSVTVSTFTNGTSRLVIVQNFGVWNTIYGTPTNPAPMFGVTQA